jgi:hypothetical protein
MQVPYLQMNRIGMSLGQHEVADTDRRNEVLGFHACGQSDTSSKGADTVFRAFGMNISDLAGLERSIFIKKDEMRSTIGAR